MTAQQRANLRWSTKGKRSAKPWSCSYCERGFATERGRDRHYLYCWKNIGSKRFTEGGWDGAGAYQAICDPMDGKVVGVLWRGDTEDQGAKVLREMRETLAALGIEVD